MEQTGLLEPLAPPVGLETPETERAWRFEVIGRPEPQGSKKGFVHPRIPGRVILVDDNAKKLKPWREQVTLTAKACRPRGWKPIDGPVFQALVFVLKRPKGHYLADGRTLSTRATRYPDTQPDSDKLERAICDSLQGVAYVNDSRIVTRVNVERWAEIGEAERVIIEVVPL